MKTFRHFWRYLVKFFRMGNILDKTCRQNPNTRFMINNFFLKLHRLWDNVKKYGGDRATTHDVTTWRIRFAFWISKAICTFSHVHAHAPGYPHARTHVHTPINNTYCFSTATMIRERVWMLRYTYTVCLVMLYEESLGYTFHSSLEHSLLVHSIALSPTHS
jgi:hypothetical protein